MTTPGFSQRTVAALAALVHDLRPDWTEPGIAAEIRRRTGEPLVHVAMALLRRSQDPANTSPQLQPRDREGSLRCARHPHSSTRTDGTCGGCYADRHAERVAAAATLVREQPPLVWQEARKRLGRSA